MQSSQIPSKVTLAFATSAGSGFSRVVPVNSQVGITPGAASFQDGFPPVTFLPVGSGGTPPWGQDFNGLLNQISAWTRWQSAGGLARYDATFSADTNVGGYPKGAVLASATTGQLWLCTVENNTSDPDNNGAGWTPISTGRLRLSGNLNLYVATTGSDSNDGHSALTAWATLQFAWNYIQSTLDLNGHTVTVNVADGTYTAGLIAVGPVVGQYLASSVTFQGNVGTPTNCYVNVSNGCPFFASGSAFYTVLGFRLSGSGSAVNQGAGIYCQGGTIQFGNCSFAASTLAHVFAQNGVAQAIAPCTITAGAITCFNVASYGTIQLSTATSITVSGTPAFSSAFAWSVGGTIFAFTSTVTITGAATGKRYQGVTSAVISTSGGGATFFPGSVAGTVDATSSYV